MNYTVYRNRYGKKIPTVGGKGTHAIKQMVDKHIDEYVEITPKGHSIDTVGLTKFLADKYKDNITTPADMSDLEDIVEICIGHYWNRVGLAKEQKKMSRVFSSNGTITNVKGVSRTISVLFLAANPKDTPALRVDEEIRSIDVALRQAEFRDGFDIKQQLAVRIADLQGYLLRYKPDLVHFSGHGSASSQIILEDNSGNSQPVTPRALSQVFSVLKDNIRCVVLNACYSEQQAQAIAQHIDCVIGYVQGNRRRRSN